jgi:hypothetical protein
MLSLNASMLSNLTLLSSVSTTVVLYLYDLKVPKCEIFMKAIENLTLGHQECI